MKLVEAMARMDVAFGNGQMELHQYIDSNGMRVSLVAKRGDPNNPSKVFKCPNQRLHYMYHHRHDMLDVAWAYGMNSAVNAVKQMMHDNQTKVLGCTYNDYYHSLAEKALNDDQLSASYLWSVDGTTLHVFIATDKYLRKLKASALAHNETVIRHQAESITDDYIHICGSSMYEALVKLKLIAMGEYHAA